MALADRRGRIQDGHRSPADDERGLLLRPRPALRRGRRDGRRAGRRGRLADRRRGLRARRARHRGRPRPSCARSSRARTAQIHSLSQHDSSRSGMGTTLTAALVEGDEISIGHVGDSRAYRFRDGELTLLTSDHSLVEELRRQGRLTDEEAEDSSAALDHHPRARARGGGRGRHAHRQRPGPTTST